MSSCFLCRSPVPISQDDANSAYVAGFVDGCVLALLKRRPTGKLCAEHEAFLKMLLNEANVPSMGDIDPRSESGITLS